MVDLSIVIVSWNACDYLVHCLDSIKASGCEFDVETIVVDNGSSDGSSEAVEELHSDVRVIRLGRNTGFAHANNVGMRAAKGRYIVLVNSDVIVKPRCLDQLVCFMERNPRVGLSAPLVHNGDGSLQPSCRRLPGLWNTLCRALALDRLAPRMEWVGGQVMRDWAHDRQRRVQALSGCFMFLRREALDEVGLFDESFFIYAEDMDLCRRLVAGGWGIVFQPEAEIVHFGGVSSANQPVRFAIEKMRAELGYWRKHHGRGGMALARALLALQEMLRMVSRLVLSVIPSLRRRHAAKLACHAGCLGWLLGFKQSPGSRRVEREIKESVAIR